jgi:ribosome production factor 2
MTIVRMFDHKILDQLELLLDKETYRRMEDFGGKKPGVGLRPLVLFAGEAWESPVPNKFTLAKSLLTDFFANREQMEKVDVEGLQYIVSFSAQTPQNEDELPQIHLRTYLIKTKRSGQKLPHVEVDEMGPRIDFRIGRTREADESVMRVAMKKAKTSEEKTKKNVQTDAVGHQVGRIHVGKQDLSKLTTRRVKALKKRGRGEIDGDHDVVEESEVEQDEQGERRKKKKV